MICHLKEWVILLNWSFFGIKLSHLVLDDIMMTELWHMLIMEQTQWVLTALCDHV